jgi:hypothetical protein
VRTPTWTCGRFGRRRQVLLLAVGLVVFLAGFVLMGPRAAAAAEPAGGVTRYGVDYSTINNVDWPVYFAELRAAGRDFIGRYLPIEGAMWRRVTTGELDAATAGGVDYFFWFENSTSLRCLDGFQAGVEDAQEALSALASLDLPATTPVYYTVDMNLGDGSRIDAYFRGIDSVVPVSQVGVYGNYTAVDWVYEHGLATYFCQTNAWSDARGWHPQAQMHQDVTQHMIGGLYVDRLSVTAADFGQCRRREQSDPRIFRAGAWETYVKTVASGGSYGRANTSKASATMYFTGTRLDWIAMKGTTAGSADVYLDGVKKATVNLAASTASYRENVWSTGALAYGNHKVEIVRSTSSATGKYVTLDAVDVVGSISALLPPTVTALTPSSGSTSGGTSVTIAGTGFTNVSAVTFGGVPATTFTVHSPTQITALTPAYTQGAVDVSVIAHGWANGNTSKDDYTYSDTSLATRFEQTDPHIVYGGAWETYVKSAASGGSYGRSKTTGASATVYFTGTRLDWIAMKGTTAGIADVYLDGVKKATVNLAASSASYRVKVWSTGTVTDGDHTIEIFRNSSSAATRYVTLDAVDVVGSLGHAPPTVAGVDPTSGGASVAITGTGFTDVMAVTFGGTPAAGYQVESSSRIVAVPPAVTPGTVDVVVTTAWGSSDPSGTADDYTILARYEQTDPHVVYEGSWETFYKSFASGGSYGRSNTSGASATIHFTGARLDWIAMKGQTAGIADVYLDGEKVASIDLNSSVAAYDVKVWSTGVIADGDHVVQIVRSDANSSAKYVTVDAVEILGTIAAEP